MANKKGWGSNINRKMVDDATNFQKASKKGFASNINEKMVSDATNFKKATKKVDGWEARRNAEIAEATGATKPPMKPVGKGKLGKRKM